MIIHNLIQGTQAWHEFRAKHFTASDAAAMLGQSPHKTRDELLNEKATGVTEEITPAQQALFDKGHRTEALAREVLEIETGEPLFPVTATHDQNHIIAASLDGIDMAGEWLFEHKLWSEKLVDFIQEHGDLPDSHWPQVEQQLFVSGAEFCDFVVSDGTNIKREILTYYSKPERLQQVLDGWDQFAKDLASYTPPVVTAEVIPKKIEKLPILDIALSGSVSHTNLSAYEKAALAIIDAVKTELVTDQDFVDAKEQVKFCKQAEEELKSKKKQALEQTASISELFDTIDTLTSAIAKTRLALDKSIKAQDAAKKAKMISEAQAKLAKHIAEISQTVAPYPIHKITADFASAIKNKKLYSKMQSAINDMLASAKIEANNAAALLKENIEFFKNTANGFEHLFPDANDLLQKEPDAAQAIIKSRITEYKASKADVVSTEPVEIEPTPIQSTVADVVLRETSANESVNPVVHDINALSDLRNLIEQVAARIPVCKTSEGAATAEVVLKGLGVQVSILNEDIEQLSDLLKKAS